MGKGREDEGVGCSDRQLRKAIHGLVKSESVITVDNTGDPDPARPLQIAQEHFVSRVRKQAAERHWPPGRERRIISCIHQLVKFEIAPNCLKTEAVTNIVVRLSSRRSSGPNGSRAGRSSGKWPC